MGARFATTKRAEASAPRRLRDGIVDPEFFGTFFASRTVRSQ